MEYMPQLIAVAIILSSIFWHIGAVESHASAWNLVFEFWGVLAILMAAFQFRTSLKRPRLQAVLIDKTHPSNPVETTQDVYQARGFTNFGKEGILDQALITQVMYSYFFDLAVFNTGQIAVKNMKVSLRLSHDELREAVNFAPKTPRLTVLSGPQGVLWHPQDIEGNREEALMVARSQENYLIYSSDPNLVAVRDILGEFRLDIPVLFEENKERIATVTATFEAENHPRTIKEFRFHMVWDKVARQD